MILSSRFPSKSKKERNIPSLSAFTLTTMQTSRLKNSQDATVTEMRAKSERTAARLRAETQAFITEKVGTHACLRSISGYIIYLYVNLAAEKAHPLVKPSRLPLRADIQP